MNVNPKDPLLSCPYDPVHRIKRSGMPRHLIKCRQNYPCTKLEKCPFNFAHDVNSIEFDYHVAHCPDRREFISYVHATEHIPNCEQISISQIQQKYVSGTEDWDAEPEVANYDLTKVLKERQVLRPILCTSKSKKKQFRQLEEKRFQEIEAKGPLDTNASSRKKNNGKFSLMDDDFGFNQMKISNSANTQLKPAKKEVENTVELDDSKNIAPSTSGKPSVIQTLQQNITKAKQGEHTEAKINDYEKPAQESSNNEKSLLQPSLENQPARSWSSVLKSSAAANANKPAFISDVIGRGSRLKSSLLLNSRSMENVVPSPGKRHN